MLLLSELAFRLGFLGCLGSIYLFVGLFRNKFASGCGNNGRDEASEGEAEAHTVTMTSKALIVGLGNPGRKYRGNRHNAGFQVVDAFAERHGLTFTKLQKKAAVSTGTIAGRSCILAKPQTYMNDSGQSVSKLVKFYKVQPEDILIIYDDLDLPTGTLRLRPDGGAGGQNGMRSIITHLKHEDFARMRIGIDRPPGKMPVKAYVLQDFSETEWSIIRETWSRAHAAIETWLTDGIELAMSRYNGPAVTT